jgi:H+/Cl- antiporter ClcA
MFLVSKVRLSTAEYLSRQLWQRRVVFWSGALMVSVVAIGFARAAIWADRLFHRAIDIDPRLALVLTPLGLGISVLLTRTVFPGAQGSGIPQVIAAGEMQDSATIRSVLSMRIAIGKLGLTLLGLASGASIGREGPTVQIGAAIMRSLGEAVHLQQSQIRALVLAGGAAGIAAAFNTPLAGVMFAIEELSHSFEERTSGTVLTAVIIAGIATLALTGSGSYFGQTSAVLPIGVGWEAVLACAVLGGLLGGAFAAILVKAADGLPGLVGRWIGKYPVLFAMLCGLLVADLGIASHGATYGTGYAQARDMVAGHSSLPPYFFALKMAASILSYASGIPGGIFAPSLAVGAGLGHSIAFWIPSAPAGAVVLLGMVAYFSGVVQAPITSAVIVMEMTDNQDMTIPLMATSFLAYGVSRLICRRALYGALATRFIAAIGAPAVSGVTMDEGETSEQ